MKKILKQVSDGLVTGLVAESTRNVLAQTPLSVTSAIFFVAVIVATVLVVNSSENDEDEPPKDKDRKSVKDVKTTSKNSESCRNSGEQQSNNKCKSRSDSRSNFKINKNTQ